jgi:hypothetical protein
MLSAINSSKIEKIYITKARQSRNLKFVEGEYEKYTFFGLIKKQDEIKPHWSGWWGETFNTREEVIEQYHSECFINEEVLFENSIWEKPHMYIVMSHSDDITIHYDSYDELMSNLKLITDSNLNLVIINH